MAVSKWIAQGLPSAFWGPQLRVLEFRNVLHHFLGSGQTFFLTPEIWLSYAYRLWPFLIFLWGWEVLHHWIRVKIHGSVPRSLWWSSTNWIPGRGWSWIITISIVNDLHIYIYILLSYIIITIFTITIIIIIHYYYIHGFRFPISQLMEVKIP